MKKNKVKNWAKYFAGTLACAGLLFVGACDSDQNKTEEVTAPETELVNREVVAEEYDEAPIDTAQKTEFVTTPIPRTSSVDINRLLRDHPEVNQAIRTSLTSIAHEQSGWDEQIVKE